MYRIFFIVFTQTAVGGVLLMSLVPPQEIGKSFFRLLSALYLLAMLLACWAYRASVPYSPSPSSASSIWQEAETPLIWASIVALFAYNVSFWMDKKLIRQLTLGIFAIFGLALLLDSSLIYLNRSIPMGRILLPLNFLSSAFLLGSANTGMLLGHWYLVTPRLPLRLLRKLTYAFLTSLVICSALTLINILILVSTKTSEFNLFSLSGYGIYFWARIGIGLLASWVLGGIIWMCVREGSTRAATGFLYIAMLTVFAGEMWGRFLLLSTSVPL